MVIIHHFDNARTQHVSVASLICSLYFISTCREERDDRNERRDDRRGYHDRRRHDHSAIRVDDDDDDDDDDDEDDDDAGTKSSRPKKRRLRTPDADAERRRADKLAPRETSGEDSEEEMGT